MKKSFAAILSWSPKSGELRTIIPPWGGFLPNDLIIVPDGGFYFSNFHGAATKPAGRIYYVSPDLKKLRRL